MVRRRYSVLATLIVFIVFLGSSVSAQRRAVRGNVTDESGAAVPGVTVELLKDGTVVRTAATGPDGQFNFDVVDLSEGQFEVRLTAAGSAPATVRLTPNTTRNLVTIGPFHAEVRSLGLAAAAPRPPETAPAPPPPEDANTHAIVPVFYATDRNRITYAPLAYGGEREPAKQLHLGRIDVSVPRDHHSGNVERPSIWTFWREDPDKHFVIVKATEQGYDQFYTQVREVVAHSTRKEAFVFVHGFNVTFESAVYRTAQIAYDLAFDGAPILYSWPSVGTPTGYPVDANNSEWTIDRLHWFLEDVAARSGANYIHVIAHSRGNWPLMNALRSIATEPRTDPRPRFSQVVLTAPDVDADNFRLLAQAFSALAERTTLYASAHDEALTISKQYQGYQRAGDVTPQIVTVNGVDSIDVSDVDTSLLGHSYYGDNGSVVSDIRRLLSTGLGPDRRCGLRAVTNTAAQYWTFVAHAICPIGDR
jgi:esterase/lipase superfamily enzyme